ncbi:STAS domain-containing protein [Streptomyces sp. LP11]|uniref:Anti-sigma factor antagonist n=1 Tax=Streptomyces pyxinicus TaxID=2970331 RepID=A0ABT2AYK2_9ACTN|nr:STAS domain-containing protein [Streptomyces sp. LP11]MCS0601332.1 STAS domain-containing protein [Streptomyces sp. LP11]
MSAELQLTVREGPDGLVIVEVAGELDFHTSNALDREVTAVSDAHSRLVLDMSQVTFCDSSGLSALLHLLRHTQATGTALTLVAVPAQTMRLLTITGSDAVFTIHGSLTEIPAAPDGPQGDA